MTNRFIDAAIQSLTLPTQQIVEFRQCDKMAIPQLKQNRSNQPHKKKRNTSQPSQLRAKNLIFFMRNEKKSLLWPA